MSAVGAKIEAQRGMGGPYGEGVLLSSVRSLGRGTVKRDAQGLRPRFDHCQTDRQTDNGLIA